MKSNAEIARYYSSLLEQHGPTFRAGDCGSLASQDARFHALLAVVPEHGRVSVLDVGCGIGSLSTRWPMALHDYEGWDFSLDVAAEAARRYPHRRFAVRDLMDSTEHDAFDYVVASGLFQFRGLEYLANAIGRMYDLCRRAVAFNVLTKSDGTDAETQHDPMMVWALSRVLSPRVVLRTDYLPNDATIYVYKEPYPSAR